MSTSSELHRVVIIGGGFGGLRTAVYLRRAPVQVTLIDRRNFHLFQPLLYQVATGTLSPANIAAPIRDVLKWQQNSEVLLGQVVDFDIDGRRVLLSDGEVPYDSLVVAAGMRNHYFGHDDWAKKAPGLKSIEDATLMRRNILIAFEAAERETDPVKRSAWLTFVVVGGGATGVELAGQIAEMARHTLRRQFRHYQPDQAKVILVEGGERILSSFHPKLSEKATRRLQSDGVEVRTGVFVTDLADDHVELKMGDSTERIATHTVLWGAGVKGSELGEKLAERTGAELDRMGRVKVQPDLSLANHPNIFVIGDLACLLDAEGKPLPGVAQVAMQQGRYVARLIQGRLRKQEPPAPFCYSNKGSMAAIGRNAAVVEKGALRISGFLAWLIWLFIHILFLVQFQNRAAVMFQWAWNYFTRNRAARLITGRVVPVLPDAVPAEQGATGPTSTSG
ncbi:MAG: NAD(P)/FAD-dependent oxidoreductase [Gemmataceae bacterium]